MIEIIILITITRINDDDDDNNNNNNNNNNNKNNGVTIQLIKNAKSKLFLLPSLSQKRLAQKKIHFLIKIPYLNLY